MPIYIYWGDDEFAIGQAVKALQAKILDPQWDSFNSDKLTPDQPNALIQALNQAMTPPFGSNQRLVWLADAALSQGCSEEMLAELNRTLSVIPETTTFLLTSKNKFDGRLKSTKLLEKHAQKVQEFPLISPWKTDQIMQRVRQVAQEVGVKLTTGSVELLAQAIGNDTRQLYNELEKLRCFAGKETRSLEPATVATLVTTSSQSSLQLATAIRQGDTALALDLVSDLLNRNEPVLKIVATLVGQFRTWLWVKLMLETGERDDRTIAQAAEISNPKRIYFLQQEVRNLSIRQLQQTLPLLLELETSLKQGAEDVLTLQTKVMELCHLCHPS